MSAQAGPEFSRDSIFRELLESVPAVFYDVPVEVAGRGGYVSPQAVDILGIPSDPPEFFFEKLYNLIHEEDKERVIHEWEGAQKTCGNFALEFRVNTRGGERYIAIRGTFLCGPNAVPLRQTGMIIDISARKRIENTLRAREERYRRITETMSDYVFTIRLDNGKVAETIHGGACQPITGYSPEEFTANPNLWIEMVHEHDRATIANRANRMLRGEDVEQLTHRIIHKSGRVRWVQSTIVTHRDDKNKVLFFDGVIRDVTEQKREEEQTKQRSYINEILLDAVPFAAILLQEDGEVLAANNAGTGMGFKIGHSWSEAWTEINAAYECGALLEAAMANSSRQLAEVKHGSLWYEVTLVPHEPDLCLCTFYDITNRKRHEETLVADKLVIEAMMANQLTCILLLDAQLRFEAINEAAARLLDVSPALVRGLSLHEIFPRQEAQQRLDCVQAAVNQRAPVRRTDQVHGRTLDTMIIPVHDEKGVLLRVAVFSRDNTEKIQAQEQLVEAYQTLLSLVEKSPNGIISLNAQGKVRLWNPAAERLFGWTAEEVYEQALPFFGEDARECGEGLVKDALQGTGRDRVDMALSCKNGQQLMVRLTTIPLLDAGGEISGGLLLCEV